jgi:hypothetical protein
MPKTANHSERLPRAVRALLGTGRADCRRCHGDGVLVLVSLSGPAFRPCRCITARERGGLPASLRAFVPEQDMPRGVEV